MLFLDPPAKLHRDLRTGEDWLFADPDKETDRFLVFEGDEDDPESWRTFYDSPEEFPSLLGVEPHQIIGGSLMEVSCEFNEDWDVFDSG